MSYIVNWITKVISVPTADLTFVSGTRYSLNMSDFLTEIRRLEWDFSGGLWAITILDHTNTRFDFAGVNYAPFDDMLNGYTVIFTGVATRIDLLGSNNDIIDVLIPSGIAIVPNNSAGLQVVDSGGAGGLTVEEHNHLIALDTADLDVAISTRLADTDYVEPDNAGITRIENKIDIIDSIVDTILTQTTEIATIDAAVEIIRKLTGNNFTKIGDIITIYEDNGVTVFKEYNVANNGRILV